ncbi:hypothetical protein BROUX41_004343 [Berkeleyomyces rouxiae]
MAIRYEHSLLLFLRDSPLCVKPKSLPPEESWIGSRQDRRQPIKTPTHQPKIDSPLFTSTRRLHGDRSTLPRHNDSDDPIGHFRSTFASSTPRSSKFSEPDKQKDGEFPDRFSHHRNNTDTDSRDTRGFRRRDDQDSEGWSTVRPRKSFGAEGAERFIGRMGGGDRYNERRTRDLDREDDGEGRPHNANGAHGPKSKDGTWFRNGSSETSTGRTNDRLDKVKTARSWRDRDDSIEDSYSGNNHRNFERRWARGEQSQRQERNPEWMDEPAGEESKTHNAEDFRKFMEELKSRENRKSGKEPDGHGEGSAENDNDHITFGSNDDAPSTQQSMPPKKIDLGPDKFFASYASGTTTEKGTPTGEPTEAAATGKGGGKSRFMSLFNASASHEDGLRPEHFQQGPLSAPIPGHAPIPGLGGMLPGIPLQENSESSQSNDQAAFQQLLSKLKISQPTPGPGTPGFQPPSQPQSQPQQPRMGMPLPASHPPNDSESGVEPSLGPAPSQAPVSGPPPEIFHQYGREPPMPPHTMHEAMTPQPMMNLVPPPMQLLQSIVGNRQQQSAQGNRADANGSNSNSNTEFLMNLMRKQPEAPIDPRMPPQQQPQPQQQQQQQQQQPIQGHSIPQQQSAPPMMQQQPPKPMHMPTGPHGLSERDEFLMQQQRLQHNMVAQQQGRGMPPIPRGMRPPGFIDDFHHEGGDPRQQQMPQANQMLQRGPPNVEPMAGGPGPNPNQWIPGGPPLPNQQRPMMPPPGLAAGGPNLGRNAPPPGMFPANFPMAGFPPDGMPPAVMPGMPPRNMMPPPGIYGGTAPPPMNFYPPPGMNYQGPPGPDVSGHYGPGPGPGPGGPYDARGVPLGGPQRGAYPRQ